jgi:hypothetical protein
MCQHLWAIDASLRLSKVPVIRGAQPVVAPEQLIDTVLLRNLDVIPNAIFGLPGRFLFHSEQYWGPFDVCCALDDGAVIAFENKSKRPIRRDIEKFARDCQTMTTQRRDYIKHRFDHVISHLQEYRDEAVRMFAAFFLRIRCDTTNAKRDLVGEAASLLGLSRHEFFVLFDAGNTWLSDLRVDLSFEEHLGPTEKTLFSNFIPVLLAPDTDLISVQDRCSANPAPAGIPARLVAYRFYCDQSPFPQWLALEEKGVLEV